MRTIRFRGKDLAKGEWRHGDLVQYDEDGVKYTTIFKDELRGHTYSVRPDSVGQFTGLHDEDNTDIYEGDILARKGWKNKCVVEWNKLLTQFQGTWDNMPMNAADIYTVIHSGYKVVGNIHDNPELVTKLNN